jgi:hypothetical protein
MLYIPTMTTMVTIKMTMKIPSMARWVEMKHQEGCWVLSAKLFRTAWRHRSPSRWSLTNWHNSNAATQLTSSVEELPSLGQPKRWFRQAINCKGTMLWPHGTSNLWRVDAISSCHDQINCKAHNLFLSLEVVVWCLVVGIDSDPDV